MKFASRRFPILVLGLSDRHPRAPSRMREYRLWRWQRWRESPSSSERANGGRRKCASDAQLGGQLGRDRLLRQTLHDQRAAVYANHAQSA